MTLKFSIVVATNRGFKDIEPIFKVSDNGTELIIVSSNYNEETKKQLAEVQNDFYKICYCPPREPKIYKRDFAMSINTGICYSENPWIVKLDDSLELKEDFFARARSVMTYLFHDKGDYKFILRPVKLEEWAGHTRWQRYPGLEKANANIILLDREGLGGNYFTTVDAAIYPIELLELINGYDERYDVGHGYDDNDIFQRVISAGYNVYLDLELMTFQYEHKIKRDDINMLCPLWDFEYIQIKNGKYRAYNPFDLKELHEKMLKQKNQYVVKG